MAEMVRSAAGVVGSAFVQDGVSRVVSFVLGKLPEKASEGRIIERLEMAHTELELALERSSKLPITEVSLLRRREMLKDAYEECGNALERCKLPALEDQENEQGVTRFSFPKRTARTADYSDVGRFEWYAACADKFMRDLVSGYPLRQYMFSDPLIMRLLQGTALEYRMVQERQVQYLFIHPINFAERAGEASLEFSTTDRKTPEKSFFLFLLLRLSESTDILGVTIECLRALLKPQIKSVVEAAMGELAQLLTQDIFDSYASSWVDEFHAEATHLYRTHLYRTSHDTLSYRFPEEVFLFYFSCSVEEMYYRTDRT